MATAAYTTGPVENSLSFNDAEFVRVRVLNRNNTGNADVTVRVFDVAGTKTPITGGAQQIISVPPQSGGVLGDFNTQPTTAFEVVVIITHPTNVDNVLISVWGLDNDSPNGTNQLLAPYRFVHQEMHPFS